MVLQKSYVIRVIVTNYTKVAIRIIIIGRPTRHDLAKEGCCRVCIFINSSEAWKAYSLDF